jgi:hypothetical protein
MDVLVLRMDVLGGSKVRGLSLVAPAESPARHRSSFHALAGLLLAILAAGPAIALTPQEYCALSRDLMALSVQEWQEKARVAKENQGASKEALVEALQRLERTSRAQQEQLYRSYATTYQDYLRFPSGEGGALDAYLASNPDLSKEIEDLSAQVEGYGQEVEAVMQAKR